MHHATRGVLLFPKIDREIYPIEDDMQFMMELLLQEKYWWYKVQALTGMRLTIFAWYFAQCIRFAWSDGSTERFLPKNAKNMAPINVSLKKKPDDSGFLLWAHDALQGYFRVEGLGFSRKCNEDQINPQINAIANTIKIIAEPFMICSLYRQSILLGYLCFMLLNSIAPTANINGTPQTKMAWVIIGYSP